MKKGNILVYILLIILLTPIYTYAYGLNLPYFTGTPLMVYPGQSTEYNAIINNKGEGEIIVLAEILEGSDMASIAEERYTIPAGETAFPIKIKVKVPETTPLGKYSIAIKTTQISLPTEAGMVSMGAGLKASIPVEVKTKAEILGETVPKKEFPWLMAIGIIVIVVLLIAYLLWRKFRKPDVIQPQQQPPQTTTQVSPAQAAPQTPVVNAPKNK